MEITKRPERSRTTASSDEEKNYKSRIVKLDIGGRDAPEGKWAGELMVLMRITPRMSRMQGRYSPTNLLEGFDPETGEPLAMFFDPRLKDDGTYARNFAGGIAEVLGEVMTPEEFDAVTDQINAESGSDFNYEYGMWANMGGPLKLKDKYVGKPVTIIKEAIKTKSGTKMHVLVVEDPLNENGEPFQYEEDYIKQMVEQYKQEMWTTAKTSKVRHASPATEEKPAGASSPQVAPPSGRAGAGSGRRWGPSNTGNTGSQQSAPVRKSAFENAVAEQQQVAKPKAPVDVRAGSNNGRNMFMSSSEDKAEEVSKEFNQGREVVSKRFTPAKAKAEPTHVPTPAPAPAPQQREADPDSIYAFIEDCFDMGINADQVIMETVKEFDISEQLSGAYVREYLKFLNAPEGGEPVSESYQQDEPDEPEVDQETAMLNLAKQLKTQKATVPKAFDDLGKAFPESTKDERKTAMRRAGIIQA